jgi:hypothetical protein
MQTLASVAATRRAWASRLSIAGERVMMPSRHSSPSPCGAPERRSASATVSSSTLLSNGFVRNPNTPRRVASTASGIVPCAVRITTGRSGRLAPDGIEEREPVHSMHAQVADDQVRALRREARESRFPGFGGAHCVSGRSQPQRYQLQQILVIVHQQEFWVRSVPWCSPRLGAEPAFALVHDPLALA